VTIGSDLQANALRCSEFHDRGIDPRVEQHPKRASAIHGHRDNNLATNQLKWNFDDSLFRDWSLGKHLNTACDDEQE
jgi:hypothetical protein